MDQLKGALQQANRILRESTRVVIESSNEYVVWRRQLVGRPNPRAQNEMAEDPEGLFWDTQDLAVHAKREGPDDMGRHTFYVAVEPVYGDLFVTVAGGPTTPEAALAAPRLRYYRVEDYDVRRDADGRIISTKVICEPDRSGRWAEPNR